MLTSVARSRRTSILVAAASALVASCVVALVLWHAGSSGASPDLSAWNGAPTIVTTWEGDVSTDWQTAGNWTSGVPNGGQYQAVIPGETTSGADVVITNIPSSTINRLTVADAGAVINAAQHLTGATPNSTLTLAFFNVAPQLTLTGGAYDLVSFSIAGGGASATFNPSTGAAAATPDFTGGSLTTSASVPLTVNGGGFTVHDTTVSLNGGISGATFVKGEGSVDLHQGAVTGAFHSENDVTVTISDVGDVSFDSLATFDDSTTIGRSSVSTTVIGGGVVNNGALTLVGPAQLVTMNVVSVVNNAGATLVSDAGSGATATIQQPLTNNGTVDVESGTLAASQTFTAGSASTLVTHLLGSGGVAGTDFTRLTVTGATTLAGTLSVQRPDTFLPAAGSTFRVATFSTPPTGAFTGVEQSGLNDGGYVTQATDATGVTVTEHQAATAVTAGPTYPGSSFTFTGTGYGASETVHVVLAFSGPNSAGIISEQSVTALADGSFTATVAVPGSSVASDSANHYFISAGGQTSGAFVRRDFTVTGKPAVGPPVTLVDTDGDGLVDGSDCAPSDAKRPARGAGVVDADCNGVDDAVQPITGTGTAGKDTFTGRGGNDTYNGGAGNDREFGAGGNDRLLGGAGNDALYGGPGLDTLLGGIGNDVIFGGDGNDTIVGEAGNDKLAGEAGNDVVNGGAGNDVVNGGAGTDRLLGGTGNDVVNALDRQVDTIVCGTGIDRVIANKADKVAADCEHVTRR
ncbi:MAG: hypothetical protein JWM98_3374 [Thermoleophilia bacterium]|nr:hypothetical protein [Thermoleophilia bacterium]